MKNFFCGFLLFSILFLPFSSYPGVNLLNITESNQNSLDDKALIEILSSNSWKLSTWEKTDKETGELEHTVVEEATYIFHGEGNYMIRANRFVLHGSWKIEKGFLILDEDMGSNSIPHRIVHLDRNKLVLQLNENTPEMSRITFRSKE